MIRDYFGEKVPVPTAARTECVTTLNACGFEEVSEELTTDLVHDAQRFVWSEIQNVPWPTVAQSRQQLNGVEKAAQALNDALKQLHGPALAALQDRMASDYGLNVMDVCELQWSAADAQTHLGDMPAGAKGRIHVLVRSAVLRWHEHTGKLPALTTDPATGKATTPFLRVLRGLVAAAMPSGKTAATITDYAFKRAIADAENILRERRPPPAGPQV